MGISNETWGAHLNTVSRFAPPNKQPLKKEKKRNSPLMKTFPLTFVCIKKIPVSPSFLDNRSHNRPRLWLLSITYKLKRAVLKIEFSLAKKKTLIRQSLFEQNVG